MSLAVGGLARAWRTLWRPRGFLPLASLTLAIGLAAFTSALAMVESLLRAPPFPHHASLVLFGEEDRDPASRAVSPMLYEAIGLPPGVISRGAAQVPESVNIRFGKREKLARAQRVDAGFLPTLGVTSVLPENPAIGFERGVMLSHVFWREWLGGDPGVVGRLIAINGAVMTVRGVLPADYRLLTDVDVLMPLSPRDSSRDGAANLIGIARLAPGTSGDAVAGWIKTRLAASATPKRQECACIPVYGTTPLDVVLTSKARPIVPLFFGCSLLVLAVAGFNLSNLMLTRALRRSQEMRLTIAFGGLGWRQRLPTIVDIVAISVGASVIGVPLARALVVAVRPLVPGSWLLSALPIDLDWRACLAAALAALAVTMVAALLGSVHATPDRLLHIQFASGSTSPAGMAQRARRAMLLVQTALATLLLVLGVATASRLWRVMQVPLGFETMDASFVEVSPDTAQFPLLDDVHHAAAAFRSAALQLPGIQAAGWSTLLPVGPGFFMPFHSPNGVTSYLRYGMVSAGAVEAMGLRLIAGRSIGANDLATTAAVAIVNQAYLAQVDGRGIGGWVTTASRLGANRPMRIVGVVADTRSAGAERVAEPTVFVPLTQVDPGAYDFMRRFVPTFVSIRGPGSAVADTQAWQKLVRSVAPGLATGPRQSFRQLAYQVNAPARRNATLAAVFAGMALSLACIGLYAVHSLEVTSGRRDIALRDALGATPMDLLGYLLSRGISMAMPGVAVGIVAAVVVERTFGHLALDTGRVDVGVTAAVALLMILAALGAVALPSLRAAVVRPTAVLRGDATTSSQWSRRSQGAHR
jgi:putative ABC transport system permease protein